MQSEIKKFNVRVYGIYIENGSVLVSVEQIGEHSITKFIGGGLEFGEGTADCLKREFKEELNIEIDIISHFYTTDFFVESFINKNHQVISVYYMIRPKNPFSIVELNELASSQKIVWLDLSTAKESDMSLVIDKKVLSLLLQNNG